MNVKKIVQLSSLYLTTLSGYPLYTAPPRNGVEARKRSQKRKRRYKKLKRISTELSAEFVKAL